MKSLEEAREDLTSENPELPKISKDWEVEWTKVQNRYKKLSDDFEKTGANSIAYFDRLDELSSSINNVELRKGELAKIKNSKQNGMLPTIKPPHLYKK